MSDEVKRGGTLSACNARAQEVTSDVIYAAMSSWTSSLFLIRILFPNLDKTIQAVRYDVITVSFPWLQLLELWRCALKDHLDCFTLAGLRLEIQLVVVPAEVDVRIFAY